MNSIVRYGSALLIFITCWWPAAYALPITPAELVTFSDRPTMDLFLEVFRPLPAVNPYPTAPYQIFPGLDQMSAMSQGLPMVIAELEKAFPGARYVGLGRDSAAVVDAINAFYLSIGQRGRAFRLDASGQSFTRATEATILKFLKTNRLDIANVLNGPGYIIFDGTHYTANSQSRRIMTTIYGEAARLGVDLAKLTYKVNFVSTSYDGYKYYPRNLIRQTDIAQFLQKTAVQITAAGPTEILSLEAWNMTHGYEWHDMFGPLQDISIDKAAALPGVGFPAQKSAVLSTLYSIEKLVHTPEFLEQVKVASRSLGFEFNPYPAKVVARQPAPPPVPKAVVAQPLLRPLGTGQPWWDARKAIVAVDLRQFDRLPILPPETPYIEKNGMKLTENGWRVYDWFVANEFPGLKAEVIAKALELKTLGKLGDRDTRNIIRQLLDDNVPNEVLDLVASYLKQTPADLTYFNTKVIKSEPAALHPAVERLREKLVACEVVMAN